MMRFFFAGLTTLFLLLSVVQKGCTLSESITSQNLAHIYKTKTMMMHPEFVVYHFSDDSSRIYIRIKKEELQAVVSQPANKIFTVKLFYKLYKESKDNIVADSGTTVFSDSIPSDEFPWIHGHADFKAENLSAYFLDLKITDTNKNFSSRFLVNVDKTSNQSAQNFLLSDSWTTEPIFYSYISDSTSISMTHRMPFSGKLLGKYFHRNFPLALPPFSLETPAKFNYKEDSLFLVNCSEINSSGFFSRSGFYHLQIDSSDKKGLTVFRFHPGFPDIYSSEQLIEPLRYLTSKSEFGELSSSSDKRQAADKFWINIGGNPERAKELIRRFYHRVKDANRFFTSFTEGWKTDRGMIFIIFGSPNIVNKNYNQEVWIYGEVGDLGSVTFSFYKVVNPFTDNDYNLNRSQIYDLAWYKTVEMWRQGRINND